MGMNKAETELELLSSVVAGGIMGGYAEEGFPFYYINHKMLSYLGYECEQDFIQDNNGLISQCMHPEDRQRVEEETNRQTDKTGSYQVEYRMRRRDGSYLWVHDNGRIIKAEDGRDAILSVCYDITAEKEYTRLIENLVDTMQGGMVLFKVEEDTRLTPCYISAGVGALSHRSNEEYGELCRKDAMDSVYPDDCESVRQACVNAVKNDVVSSCTYRILDKNGGYTWINGLFSRYSEADGVLILRAVFTPASLQYEVQMQALNQNSMGIVVLDADTREVYYANNASFLLHSTQRREYMGRKCHEVFGGKDAACKECWMRSVADRADTADCVMQKKERYISIHAEKQLWNGHTVYVEYLQDVTEQQQTQKQLKEIFSNVPGGVCLYRWDGTKLQPLSVSRHFSDFFGVDGFELMQEVEGTNYTTVHPDDLPGLQQYILQHAGVPGEGYTYTYRVWNVKRKQYLWLRATGNVFAQADGGNLLYINYADVTEEMKLQTQLRQNKAINDAACRFAGLWVFGYDIDSGVAYPNTLLQQDFGLPPRLENYPESFIAYHLMLPEYEETYLDAVKRIRNGAQEAEAVIRIRYRDQTVHWLRFHLNRMADNDSGNYAIGSALLIDQEKALEARIEIERQKTESYDSSLLRYLVINVTRNRVIEQKAFRGDIASSQVGMTMEQVVSSVGEHAFYDESWEEYRRLHDCARLTELCNSGKDTLCVEGRHKIAGDDLVWVRNAMNLLRDPATGDIYLYEYTYDIDSQKKQEEILCAAVHYDYERLASLSLQTGKLTRLMNREARDDILLQTDDYAETYTQYLDSFVLQEDRESFLRGISIDTVEKSLDKQGKYSFTFRVKEGNEIRFKRTGFEYYNRAHRLVLMTRSDVTDLVLEEEQKRQELLRSNEEKAKLLQERERLYAALYSIMPMVISANVTQGYYSMLNYDNYTTKKAPLSGTYEELVSIGISTVPEDQQKAFEETFCRENVLRQYAAGKKSVVLIHQQLGDDGVLRWIETRSVFIKDDSTGDLYSITLAQDVTAQREGRIRLQTALEAAEAATRAKSEFLSRMSHEIRTPMNAIIGMTAVAKENRADYSQVSECLDKIDMSSHFLLTLINDILEMSRIESGRTEIKSNEFSFDFLIESIRTVVEPLALKSGLRYEFKNDAQTDSHYIGDATRIQQIMVNLISNAIKFTKQNGRVRFSVHKDSETENCANLRFVVEDTGIGIGEEFMKKIFKPFAQEDGSNTSEYGGSGLGLAISKSLIEAMGGKISVESFRGIGSTFTVELPLGRLHQASAVQTPAAEKKTEADLSILAHSRVLMAEDHPLNVMVATKILKGKGVAVVVAENGQIAVDKFNASSAGFYDAILMDIRMPVMDGLDAARAIRRLDRPDARTIPIIAMTANALDEDRRKTQEAGMNAHLAKPFEPAQLYRVLAEKIQEAR